MSQRDSGEKVRWLSGDADFDSALDVRTNDGVRLAMLLAPEARKALQKLLAGKGVRLFISAVVFWLLLVPGCWLTMPLVCALKRRWKCSVILENCWKDSFW